MPKPYVKVTRGYAEKDVEKALVEIRSGKSIRGTAKKYGMSESMLRKREIRIKIGREGI